MLHPAQSGLWDVWLRLLGLCLLQQTRGDRVPFVIATNTQIAAACMSRIPHGAHTCRTCCCQGSGAASMGRGCCRENGLGGKGPHDHPVSPPAMSIPPSQVAPRLIQAGPRHFLLASWLFWATRSKMIQIQDGPKHRKSLWPSDVLGRSIC